MAQISYTNKVALNENPDIADINKVTDDDMNEIKSVVNANYNNTIQITDTEPTDSDNKIWIDTGEVSAAATEITNEYSTSTGLGYSANYINELVPNIQSGTVNFGIVNGNTSTAQTITLSKPYSNTNYKVFCNFQNAGYYWESYSNFIIANKTTTGFEIQWKNNGSGNTNNDIYVSWLTIN